MPVAVTVTDRQLLRSGTLPIAAVFLLGLCLAAGAAWWWQEQSNEDAETQFQRSVERVSAEVVARFRRPVDGLNGAKGLFAASKSVERAEFRAYVESRDLPQDFPGVRGFGFIQRVMRPQLDVFVAAELIDRHNHLLEIWNGGIPGLLAVSGGHVTRRFASSHLPFGVVDADQFDPATEVWQWHEAHSLLMFSDGLTEAENTAGRCLTEDEIITALGENNDHGRLKAALDEMLEGALAHDDISVVTVALNIP